jgi:N-acetylneuraminic acid mutarotase
MYRINCRKLIGLAILATWMPGWPTLATADEQTQLRNNKSQQPIDNPAVRQLPMLPEGITSFGAAVIERQLYIYGGHHGEPHDYAYEGQSDQLLRLNLDQPEAWESVSQGPRLQGLAMVAHGGKLYRIGGFTAKNHTGEPHDWWSVDEVAAWDIATGTWQAVPSLPEPRSSHDAIVLGDSIYVVGGWALQGSDQKTWHASALRLNLNDPHPQWEELPAPPFARRALSLGILSGRIYAIGGMDREQGPTTAVAVFDPATSRWSTAPSIHGEGMDGFGIAACTVANGLLVTTYNGTLQQLTPDGSEWKVLTTFAPGRFFHRMIALDDQQVLLFGGAHMESGRIEAVQRIDLAGKLR